jgi:hypothetical protein
MSILQPMEHMGPPKHALSLAEVFLNASLFTHVTNRTLGMPPDHDGE